MLCCSSSSPSNAVHMVFVTVANHPSEQVHFFSVNFCCPSEPSGSLYLAILMQTNKQMIPLLACIMRMTLIRRLTLRAHVIYSQCTTRSVRLGRLFCWQLGGGSLLAAFCPYILGAVRSAHIRSIVRRPFLLPIAICWICILTSACSN